MDKEFIRELKRIMKLVMLEEDINKYIDSAKEILKLFNEIDKYYEMAKDLDPLYHPISYVVPLRKDEPADTHINMSIFSKVDEDGYVVAPPLRGKKKLI